MLTAHANFSNEQKLETAVAIRVYHDSPWTVAKRLAAKLYGRVMYVWIKLFTQNVEVLLFTRARALLHKKVAERVPPPIRVRRMDLRTLKNGRDTEVKFAHQSVRGKNILLFHTTKTDRGLVQLLLALNALKETGAGKIALLLGYMGYARGHENYPAKEYGPRAQAANMAKFVLEIIKEFADELITVNVHFLKKPQDNKFLYLKDPAQFTRSPRAEEAAYLDFKIRNFNAIDLLVRYYLEGDFDIQQPFLIAPDRGIYDFVQEAALRLGLPSGYLVKKRLDSRHIEQSAEVYGEDGQVIDIKDYDAIILDDIVAGGSTTIGAAKIVRQLGARKVFAGAVHGIFIKGTAMFDEVLDHVVSTDSIISAKSSVSLADVIVEFLGYTNGASRHDAGTPPNTSSPVMAGVNGIILSQRSWEQASVVIKLLFPALRAAGKKVKSVFHVSLAEILRAGEQAVSELRLVELSDVASRSMSPVGATIVASSSPLSASELAAYWASQEKSPVGAVFVASSSPVVDTNDTVWQQYMLNKVDVGHQLDFAQAVAEAFTVGNTTGSPESTTPMAVNTNEAVTPTAISFSVTNVTIDHEFVSELPGLASAAINRPEQKPIATPVVFVSDHSADYLRDRTMDVSSSVSSSPVTLAQKLAKQLAEYAQITDVTVLAALVRDLVTRAEKRLTGDIVSLKTDIPTFIIPDIHNRFEALLELVQPFLSKLTKGEIQILSLGDLWHSENKHIWKGIQAAYYNGRGQGEPVEMDLEMSRALRTSLILLTLQEAFPSFVHVLMGNHENITNSHLLGKTPVNKFIMKPGAGAFVRQWVERGWERIFLCNMPSGKTSCRYLRWAGISWLLIANQRDPILWPRSPPGARRSCGA